jgi:hypothetical protein
MAGEITTVRDGIETRLLTISGLQVYDFMPDSITVVPVVTIAFDGMTYNETFEGASTAGDRSYRWVIKLRLAGSIPQEQWQELDSYIAPTGSKSILAAIDGDKTLGGACEWAVISPGEPVEATDLEQRTDGWYYVMEFPLETYLSG